MSSDLSGDRLLACECFDFFVYVLDNISSQDCERILNNRELFIKNLLDFLDTDIDVGDEV